MEETEKYSFDELPRLEGGLPFFPMLKKKIFKEIVTKP
jgi:hypothetical protein